MSAQPAIYDLLVKGGHVIDPANHRNGRFDIAVSGGKIAGVGTDLPASRAKLLVEAGQYYVTPGLIDINTHLDFEGAWRNVQPDPNCLPHGVTTAVDAGSTGPRDFERFKKTVVDRSQTRVLAFLRAGPAPQYPAFAVGFRASADSLESARHAAERSRPVLMLDGVPPGELRQGDIYTGVYGLTAPRNVWEARKRGVLFDVGHGSAGFWFRVAAPAIRAGLLPDTISTGMDKESLLLPRANMTTTLSKFLNLGLTLEQVIERATVNPARAIRRPELGTLSEGAAADLAVLALETGKFGFLDSGHARLTGNRSLRCVLTVRQGKVVWDAEGLSLTDWTHAGPYSNFK